MANIEYIQTCILFHIGTETYLVESENDTPNHIKLVREGCKKKEIVEFSTKVGWWGQQWTDFPLISFFVEKI